MNSTSANASEPSKRARPCARQAAGRQHRHPGRGQAPPPRQRPGTTSQRRQHQQSASQANAPAREDTNARDFSSPPLIAIRPLLYPPPARRRVLLAQTRTFAGSRAQKLIRCDAFFSFPAGPGEKMEGGQKIWNAHVGGGARGKRNAGGREIGTGIIFAASRKWWKELARRKLLGRTDGPRAGGGVTPGW
jgi:hypothetical protein